MLTALQNNEYKSGEPLTDKQIAHIMIALLMAGQHTSAATGSWAILHLGQRPDLQCASFFLASSCDAHSDTLTDLCRAALHAEQVESYMDKSTGVLRPLDYATVTSDAPLLSAVIKEILRVHPPLHSLMRKVISDCPVPTSLASPSSIPTLSAASKKSVEGLTYTVPKGYYVLAAPGISQVDKAIWGADAGEFDEKRWLEGGKGTEEQEDEGEEDYGWGKISKGGKSACRFNYLPSSGYPVADMNRLTVNEDLPFGAGRHRCIGEQFANVQLGTILSTLIREATWTIDQDFPGQDYTVSLITRRGLGAAGLCRFILLLKLRP